MGTVLRAPLNKLQYELLFVKYFVALHPQKNKYLYNFTVDL